MLCGARGKLLPRDKGENDFGNQRPGSREGAGPKVEIVVEVADTTQT